MSFPTELSVLPQWICWRLEPDPKGDKPKKVPYDPKNGRKASSTNPQTWATLAEAQAARDKFMFTGIGFVFTEASGIVGVDIDHCRKEDGTLNDTTKAILEKQPSYTEISPSGTGLHIFYHGAMPGKGNKNSTSGVEMYATGRYFTMTGQHLEGTPEVIMDGVTTLPWIHETYVAKKRKEKKRTVTAKTVKLSDDVLLEKARASANGECFSALWDGKWQEKFGSQSEADLSLCCSLAFWSGKNVEQMDRLFRLSGLMREKWDNVHHADGATYGAETVQQAIDRTEQVYSPEGEPVIFENNGRYYRVKGEAVYALTNFVVHPLEMLVAEDETQMTCDLVTIYDETFRQTFMTTDFGNLQKFKGVLNKRTISLSYTGTEGDLELLKGYLAGLEWQKKFGVKALGLHERNGRWIAVGKNGAVAAGNEIVDDMVQLEKYASIESDLLATAAIMPEHFAELGPLLLGYNEPAKTVSVLAWCAGCFVKELLRKAGVKYPHLFLIGEAGSGKSNTLERVILPIFGRSKVVAAPQVTAFTLMKDAASSNLFPQALDEFKPSKIDRYRLDALQNHMRDSYDGHAGVRGRADQTQVSYDLFAPLVVAGEESADETAVRERGMELLFSKRDLKDPACRASFQRVSAMQDELPMLGRALLETVLTLSTKVVLEWHNAALALFNAALPSRIVNNLACCVVGLRLVEVLCTRLGFRWEQVFPIGMDACVKHMEYAAREYLLDGGDANKSIIEQTLEIMDRMTLNEEYCTFSKDGKEVAFLFARFYDQYTKYRRDHAIYGECLPYNQFIKQLKKSDLFLAFKTVRMGSGTPKAYVLDYELIQQRCNVSGFLGTDVPPLR